MADSQQRGAVLVDTESGVVLGEWVIKAERVKQQDRGIKGGFFMGQLAKIGEIADSRELTSGDKELFLKLLSKLDWENFIYIELTQIARELGKTRTSISLSMKHLVEHEIVFRGPRVGKSYTYRLNPSVAWVGEDKRRRALEAQMRRQNMRVIQGKAHSGAYQQALFGEETPVEELAEESSETSLRAVPDKD